MIDIISEKRKGSSIILSAYARKTIGVLSENQKIREERVDCEDSGGENGEPQRKNEYFLSLYYVKL